MNNSVETISRYLFRCTALTKKQAYVISKRLAGETLINIGKEIGVGRSRVEQIEDRGLRNIRYKFKNIWEK